MERCRRCNLTASREVDGWWWCDGCLVAHLVSTATVLKDALAATHEERPAPLDWCVRNDGRRFVRGSNDLRQILIQDERGGWAWMLGMWHDEYGCDANIASGVARTREEAEAALQKVTAQVARGAGQLAGQ